MFNAKVGVSAVALVSQIISHSPWRVVLAGTACITKLVVVNAAKDVEVVVPFAAMTVVFLLIKMLFTVVIALKVFVPENVWFTPRVANVSAPPKAGIWRVWLPVGVAALIFTKYVAPPRTRSPNQLEAVPPIDPPPATLDTRPALKIGAIANTGAVVLKVGPAVNVCTVPSTASVSVAAGTVMMKPEVAAAGVSDTLPVAVEDDSFRMPVVVPATPTVSVGEDHVKLALPASAEVVPALYKSCVPVILAKVPSCAAVAAAGALEVELNWKPDIAAPLNVCTVPAAE